MASTQSPTCTPAGSPSVTVGRSLASIFSTATSVAGSLPSTLAANSRRSVSFTVTCLASRTTWALVSTRPSALTMKPEPWPRTGISRWPGRPPLGPWKRLKNSKNGSLGSMPCGPRRCAAGASSASLMASFMPLTLMLTTAAPLRAVIWEKSGAPTAVGVAPIGVIMDAPGNAVAVGAAARACVADTKVAPAPPSTPAATSARTKWVGVIERVVMRTPGREQWLNTDSMSGRGLRQFLIGWLS